MGRSSQFVLNQIKNAVGRDVFTLIKRKLTYYEVEMCYQAHGSTRNHFLTVQFSWYCARNGFLKLLQWAKINHCPWDSRTCSDASRHGRLELLQWVYENGCTWTSDTCSKAALNGHLEILVWLKTTNCP